MLKWRTMRKAARLLRSSTRLSMMAKPSMFPLLNPVKIVRKGNLSAVVTVVAVALAVATVAVAMVAVAAAAAAASAATVVVVVIAAVTVVATTSINQKDLWSCGTKPNYNRPSVRRKGFHQKPFFLFPTT